MRGAKALCGANDRTVEDTVAKIKVAVKRMMTDDEDAVVTTMGSKGGKVNLGQNKKQCSWVLCVTVLRILGFPVFFVRRISQILKEESRTPHY